MELIIHIKMDLALNNLQRLICHKKKTKPISMYIWMDGWMDLSISDSFYRYFYLNIIMPMSVYRAHHHSSIDLSIDRSQGQINLSKYYLYSIGILDVIKQ